MNPTPHTDFTQNSVQQPDLPTGVQMPVPSSIAVPAMSPAETQGMSSATTEGMAQSTESSISVASVYTAPIVSPQQVSPISAAPGAPQFVSAQTTPSSANMNTASVTITPVTITPVPSNSTPDNQVSHQVTAVDSDNAPSNSIAPAASGSAESETPSTINPELNDALKKSQYFNNSIFWIEVEKIVPNPYQPRKEFDQHALRDLADSIRMYGLLQPLVVTRKEITKEDGGLAVRYELISGERRLRASKLSGLTQVPVIIRAGEEDARVKLELAIIENLQREDLNPVDRARSFQRLSEEFGLKHAQIAEKMGKSREYVTNSIRLLALPPHMLDALSEKKISEGHTRPLLMLADRPEEQEVLFREITLKKMTVREAERIARGVAVERVRKHDQTPELKDLEKQLNQAFGTRVFIEKKEQGGKVVIDFFNVEDVRNLIDLLNHAQEAQRKSHTTTSVHSYNSVKEMMNELSAATPLSTIEPQSAPLQSAAAEKDIAAGIPPAIVHGADAPIDDSSTSDIGDDEEIYSIRNFSI